MLSAIPTSWGSALEVPSRASPAFASEVPPFISNNDGGLQYVAFSLPEDGADIFAQDEALPSIDETLFDFVEVPELEEVSAVDDGTPPSTSLLPLEDLLLEEIPALEDAPPFDDQTVLPWEDNEVVPKMAAPESQWDDLKVTIPAILVEEPMFATEEVIGSPASGYVESCGSESPLSCYSVESPPEKRRRVSQISMSSYCSSAGDSLFSPTSSTSDSESESKRGGRRSRYSPEDRKERKKAQNRTAAERYRQKRKIQEETIGEEEQQLIDGNNALKIEVTKLQAEVSCMKRLMREMLLAKGIAIPPKKKNSAMK